MPSEDRVTVESPIVEHRSPYARSKTETERELRTLQGEGKPITIVYPGALFGLGAPALDPSLQSLQALRGPVAPIMPGGLPIVDVRDAAQALTRCLIPGQGTRGYLLGGAYLTYDEVADHIDALTGVTVRRIHIPRQALLAFGSLLDLLRKLKRVQVPLTRESAELGTGLAPTDDTSTLAELQLTLRPVEETLSEAVRWLAEHRYISPGRAGRLAVGVSDKVTAEQVSGTPKSLLKRGPMGRGIADGGR
jgi:nucleoside-diphosphate-sugar epimerase